MPDKRSIGCGTEEDIRSARTGDLLGTSQIAKAEVKMLFDSNENKKPQFNLKKFQQPRKLIKQNEQNESVADFDDEYDDWMLN